MSDLCCNRIPLACSRRDMLRLAACGFGSIAFAAMAARASGVSAMTGGDDDDTATNPLAAKTALCANRQAHHLPLHGGRA